jgi:hypothetical protein
VDDLLWGREGERESEREKEKEKERERERKLHIQSEMVQKCKWKIEVKYI